MRSWISSASAEIRSTSRWAASARRAARRSSARAFCSGNEAAAPPSSSTLASSMAPISSISACTEMMSGCLSVNPPGPVLGEAQLQVLAAPLRREILPPALALGRRGRGPAARRRPGRSRPGPAAAGASRSASRVRARSRWLASRSSGRLPAFSSLMDAMRASISPMRFGEALELAADEFGRVSRSAHPLPDVLLDEVVGQPVGDRGGRGGRVRPVDELEGVDLQLLVAPARLLRDLQLGQHRVDPDVAAHEGDDLLPGHLLGLLGIEVQVVDDLGETTPREDLHGHEVEAVVEIALVQARLHEALGDGLGLDQQGGVGLVLVGQERREEDRPDEDRPRHAGTRDQSTARDAYELADLEAGVEVHGRVVLLGPTPASDGQAGWGRRCR